MTLNVAKRRSPMNDALEHLSPGWSQLHGMPAAVRVKAARPDIEQARVLGLCDITPLPRIGVKGAVAEAWLGEQGINVPRSIYEHRPLEPNGLIVRVGGAEFLIEDGKSGQWVSRLEGQAEGPEAPAVPRGVYRFPRQDAAMVLGGEKSPEVMAQTCSYDFRESDSAFVMTRVAGVSCSILHGREQRSGTGLFRIWCDPSYGMYLWETLLRIMKEVGGDVVGLGWLFPDLLE